MVIPIKGPASALLPLVLSAALLLWPAYWNGYPLVFADTGTYLSQAIEHYVGWDRTIFYSLFLLPLHMATSTWPCIAAQALLAIYTCDLVRRVLLPESSTWWLLPVSGVLSLATPLPWYAAQLVPDIFTPLLVLSLTVLAIVPNRLSRLETVWLIIFTAFLIAAHQSHVPLAIGLVLMLLPLRSRIATSTPLKLHGVLIALAAPALAISAMIAVNVVAFGRASPSPFGNVFVLARIIYDGPGMEVLRRECPDAGWRLCTVEEFPANSDDFLWQYDGPLAQSGGGKRVSEEADAIILAALRAEPGKELQAGLQNAVQQLTHFATGDGLRPWPTTVTPVIQRDFPIAELSRYAAATQTRGELTVPAPFQTIYLVFPLLGVVVCCAILPLAWRAKHVATAFAAATLVALIANATITGALSGPHSRYQSRIMWLPPLVALFTTASVLRDKSR